jgi:hypothetical protein
MVKNKNSINNYFLDNIFIPVFIKRNIIIEI